MKASSLLVATTLVTFSLLSEAAMAIEPHPPKDKDKTVTIGGDSSGGGDAAAQDFYRTTEVTFELVSEWIKAEMPTDPTLARINLSKLRVAFKKDNLQTGSNSDFVIVSSAPELRWTPPGKEDPIEVDAVNFPKRTPPELVINRTRWMDPLTPWEWRFALPFHEGCAFIGLDDQLGYEFSKKFENYLKYSLNPNFDHFIALLTPEDTPVDKIFRDKHVDLRSDFQNWQIEFHRALLALEDEHEKELTQLRENIPLRTPKEVDETDKRKGIEVTDE